MLSWLRRRNSRVVEGELVGIDRTKEQNRNALILCIKSDHRPESIWRLWNGAKTTFGFSRNVKLLAKKVGSRCSYEELNQRLKQSPPRITLWLDKKSTYIFDYEIG